MPFFYSSDTQDGKITTLIVNNNTTLSEIICNNYHKITKNYIIESSISDTDEDEHNCNCIINTNIYENIDKYLDRYDIITLHGTLKYINGESPTRYYPNNSGLNESQLCKYNKEVKRFVYDANGNRISKEYDGELTKYYYDINSNLVKEEGEDIVDYLYDNTNKLYAMILNGIKYYYVEDITGTIIGLLDEEGILVEEYQYDAYGVVLSTNTLYNPFLYKGYYYDKETSMYYCKSRYYAPELCRFISPDSIEYLDPESANGLNLYCYCMNNPIMYSDGSGHAPEWWQWLISGALIVGGIALSVATAGVATSVLVAVLATIGGIAGSAAVGAGAGSLIGGYINEASGGSFGLDTSVD